MRRRKKHVTHTSHDRWLVSYADFITLLFAFFVVMYSTAQVDKKKVGRLATAIQVAFQQLGAYPTADLSSTEPIEQTVEILKVAPVLPRTPENHDLTDLRKELEQALAPEISRGEVEVRAGHEGLVISLREAGFFDSGSAGVKVGSQSGFQPNGRTPRGTPIQHPHRRAYRQCADSQHTIYFQLGTLHRPLDRDDSGSDYEIRFCSAVAIGRWIRRISSYRQQHHGGRPR